MAMTSLFGNLFLAIQERLQTIPRLSFIDHEYGQLEYYDRENGKPPVTFPCVLIDIDQATFTDNSDNGQLGNCIVILRLGFPPYSATSQNTPQAYKEKALEFYEIETDIHNALQGWCPGDEYNVLDRKSAMTERREDFIRVRQIRYSTGFDDYTTSKTWTKVAATPNITGEYL